MLFCILQIKSQQHYLNIPKFIKQLIEEPWKKLFMINSTPFDNFSVKSTQFLD